MARRSTHRRAERRQKQAQRWPQNDKTRRGAAGLAGADRARVSWKADEPSLQEGAVPGSLQLPE